MPKSSGLSDADLDQNMSSVVQSLTEKEKQALRLLVNGYDAKSMARQLGLSVHTINERLREARRKLAVSSSREAARKLRELEGPSPDFLGPNRFGDATIPQSVPEAASPAERRPMRHSVGWVAGATLMTISLALIALSALSGTADEPKTTLSQQTTNPAVETEAVQAARLWLALVDAGDWQRSWDATSHTFQSLNTSARWAAVAASVQTPLGANISHQLVSEDFVPAPPSGYQLIKFKSRYANKAEALLTLTLERENERWKVSGITLD
jgi:DNA-binding CsgD family transcriptional regulator